MRTTTFYRRVAAAALLVTLPAGAALADRAAEIAQAPLCPEAFTDVSDPATCRLRLGNPGFEGGVMGAWMGSAAENIHGQDFIGLDPAGAGGVAVLRQAGDGVSQVVPLPSNVGLVGGKEAHFTISFQGKSDGGTPVKVMYRLRAVDDQLQNSKNITGGTVTFDGNGDVHTSSALHRDLPEGGQLIVELFRENDESPGFAAYIDDVAVAIESRR